MNEQQKKAAEYAEILLAFSRGEKLQFWCDYGNKWRERKNPDELPEAQLLYRITPKPVERWAVIDGRGEFWGTYDKEHQAAYSSKDKNGRYFLMREVTE